MPGGLLAKQRGVLYNPPDQMKNSTNEDLSERFIKIYNELDDFIRKKLNAEEYEDHASLLRVISTQNKLIYSFYKDLKMFSQIRNLLVHNPYKNKAKQLLYPDPYVVQMYEDIKNKIISPQKALAIAIKREQIFTITLKDNVIKVMGTMNEKTYTHVPVIEDESMIGIFSENTILSYLVNNKDSIITNDLLIEEFRDFIPLEKHSSENFEFVGRSAFLSEVEEIFKRSLKKRKRVGVVFITETGKQSEKLLGMITAWDIAGKE